MADKLPQTAQDATSHAQGSASDASQKWDAMSEEQKQKTFASLPEDKKKNMSYTEWIKDGYHRQYENWMPWIEDMYLQWFTTHNKASYATKGECHTLDKSKVTGVEPVDQLQDGVHNLAAGQIGQGGLLQPVGDAVSKEGINRAERGGKDDSGSYGGGAGGAAADRVAGGAKSAQNAGGSLYSGASGAVGSVTGMLGGGQTADETKK